MVDTETGPGVFETALAYTDALRMADNGCLFKLVAKSVGMKYGIIPTFMAKPYTDVSPFTLVLDPVIVADSQMPGCSGYVFNLLFSHSGQ